MSVISLNDQLLDAMLMNIAMEVLVFIMAMKSLEQYRRFPKANLLHFEFHIINST